MQEPGYVSSSQRQNEFAPANGSLSGKVILITGATGGLGTALSKECACLLYTSDAADE